MLSVPIEVFYLILRIVGANPDGTPPGIEEIRPVKKKNLINHIKESHRFDQL